MAIVPQASRESRRDGVAVLDLAKAVGRCKRGSLSQHIIYVGRALPCLEDRGNGKRRVEAVQVPVKRTSAAGDDGPHIGGRCLAVVAKHGVAILALFEEVGNFLVAILLPAGEATSPVSDLPSPSPPLEIE